MCLIAWIRVLITTMVLASYSPLAIGHGEPDAEHVGHLSISLFIGRRTRVAAAQHFSVSGRALVCSSVRIISATPWIERAAKLGCTDAVRG